MNEKPENPFASPATVAAKEYREFYVLDHEIATRENFQLLVAAILVVLFSTIWGSFAFYTSATLSGEWIGNALLAFMTFSCVATVMNHWMRARRGWQRFPLVIDVDGIHGKFEEGGDWKPRRFRWNEVVSVKFVPRNRMVVSTLDGAAHTADLSLVRSGKWHQLRETLKFYSDSMAKRAADSQADASA
ncbi:hypothetical protein AB1L30_09310 [Bremerella sp. JC817]|uniref:hypothetical protein n=1 Tax=Bremerella sp. JC817 TaxID=3231756 RepID=UPI003457D578